MLLPVVTIVGRTLLLITGWNCGPLLFAGPLFSSLLLTTPLFSVWPLPCGLMMPMLPLVGRRLVTTGSILLTTPGLPFGEFGRFFVTTGSILLMTPGLPFGPFGKFFVTTGSILLMTPGLPFGAFGR